MGPIMPSFAAQTIRIPAREPINSGHLLRDRNQLPAARNSVDEMPRIGTLTKHQAGAPACPRPWLARPLIRAWR